MKTEKRWVLWERIPPAATSKRSCIRRRGSAKSCWEGGKIQTPSLVQSMYFSDVSSSYSFGYAINVQYGNLRSYTFDVELDSGIIASQSLRFSASDLKRVDFNVRYRFDGHEGISDYVVHLRAAEQRCCRDILRRQRRPSPLPFYADRVLHTPDILKVSYLPFQRSLQVLKRKRWGE